MLDFPGNVLYHKKDIFRHEMGRSTGQAPLLEEIYELLKTILHHPVLLLRRGAAQSDHPCAGARGGVGHRTAVFGTGDPPGAPQRRSGCRDLPDQDHAGAVRGPGGGPDGLLGSGPGQLDRHRPGGGALHGDHLRRFRPDLPGTDQEGG